MDDFVPICCFCSKVRDDTGMEVGKGSWIDLSIYAAYRSRPVWASLKSLREVERRLTARTGRGQRNIKR